MLRLFLALLLMSSAVAAQEAEPGAARSEDFTFFDSARAMPARVRGKATCERGPDQSSSRLRFGSGYLFEVPCIGDTKNINRALVFARSPEGADARRMHFPVPRGVRRIDFSILTNPRYFPAAGEIREVPVGRGGRDCRTDARWRIDEKGKASLTYWSETADCEGQSGWRTVIDRRSKR